MMIILRWRRRRREVMLAFLLLRFARTVFGQSYEPYYLYNLCNNYKNFTAREGVDQLLQNLKTNTSFPDYATASNDSLSLHALLQCRRDLPAPDCARCSTDAATNLTQRCPQQVDAMIWFDGCFLRYDNQSFFSTLDTEFYFDFWNPVNVNNNNSIFVEKNSELIRSLACEAESNGRGFAMGSINYSSTNMIYGLVQCNQDLSMEDCSQCLQIAVNRSTGPCQQNYGLDCPSKIGRRILMKNCYTQYELTMFYNDSSQGLVNVPSSNCNFTSIQGNGNAGQSKGKSNKTIYYVLGGVVGGVLFLGLIFFIIVSNTRRKVAPPGLNSILAPINENEIQVFSWDAIVAATNNFSNENKLGEGAFGVVYLGRLDNGREIAVKRLLFKSGQGRKEFLNEVGLVANLQHRNLVSLIGGCVEDQERILVYEYMPNSSLDTILFDPIKKSRLNWEARFELIMGIARGLLYLHEDSTFHVIHRDIKAANVLLDDQLHPKIADFGMARLCSDDQSFFATRVGGTYGYMAPEYVMHGILSTKVDIYSFGVLVLEIISGRKNNDPTLPMAEAGVGLVGWASTQEKQGRALDLVDPDLEENWPEEFVLRCIHVALLCTESMSSKRPSISIVLMMLSSDSATLPGISNHSSNYSSSTNTTDPLLVSVNELSITDQTGR